MNIPFYQCNSNGNNFKIIFHRNSIDTSIFTKENIKKFCKDSNDLYVDGLILLNYKNNSFYMDYFNNDGSWETFCLNGMICCSLVLNKKFNMNSFNIFSNSIKYETQNLENNYVKVKIKKPEYKLRNLQINGCSGDYLDSGAKHLVINYGNDWSVKSKLMQKMKKIRYDKLFKPDGINVNFYKEINHGIIQVKTYEKGIESIMDSCASGSYACAYVYSKKNKNIDLVKIINDGGSSEVSFDKNFFSNFFSSRALIEFKGNIEV